MLRLEADLKWPGTGCPSTTTLPSTCPDMEGKSGTIMKPAIPTTMDGSMSHGSIQNDYVHTRASPVDDRSTNHIDAISTPTSMYPHGHVSITDTTETKSNVDPVSAVPDGQRQEGPHQDFHIFDPKSLAKPALSSPRSTSHDSLPESLDPKVTKAEFSCLNLNVPSVPRHPAQELSATRSDSPDARSGRGDGEN